MAEMIFRMHEGDLTVTGALGRLQTAGRSVVLESTGLDNIGNLVATDRLFILGHGETTNIGGKTAAELAKLLTSSGLKSGVHIELVACNSGTGNAPFALELKVELVSRKVVPASVSGGTSYMQVAADGTTTVADYNFATSQWSAQITDGSETVQTPWGPRLRNVVKNFKTG